MSDLISREAALERAEACTFTDKNEKRKFMDWLNYCLDAAIEPQWIPCSERLPVENGWYLVTNILGVVQQQYWGTRKWQKLREEFVIAWQPLPQPYKAEQT